MKNIKNLKVGTLLEYRGEWAILEKHCDNGDLFIRMINKDRNEIIRNDMKEHYVQPLKLTRTIVQKLGFKKENPHFNKYMRSYILVEFTSDEIIKVYQIEDDVLTHLVDIMYAHELQELYSNITKEEAYYERYYSVN